MGVVVELRKEELIEAGVGGLMRHTRALLDGRRQSITHDGTKPKSFGPDVDGALGEKAVAKYLNRYWSATCVRDLKAIGGDVGKGVEVKTSFYPRADLRVEPDFDDAAAFVLVLGDPPRFTLAGWTYARDAKRPEWLRSLNNGPLFYWVPQTNLRPVEELTHILAASVAS